MKLILAIVGSRAFTNESYVLKVLQKYIDKLGKENLAIVSGGCPDGADALAKKVALDQGIPYIEFPPVHRPHNRYCVLPPTEYGKSYHVKNYFERNSRVAAFCDHLLAFVIKGVRCNGTMDTFNKAKKLGKQVVLFEEEIKHDGQGETAGTLHPGVNEASEGGLSGPLPEGVPGN